MKVTLSQIEAFYWITRLGSFRAAAAHLNLTQPTISQRIRTMEQALGVNAFHRVGRSIRLTEDGGALLEHAREIIDVAGRLVMKSDTADPLHGRLRLGAPTSIALTCMTELLRTLQGRHTRLDVALTIDKSTALQRRLDDREIDVAVMVEPALSPHTRIVPLGHMKHAWVAHPKLGFHDKLTRPKDLVDKQLFTQPDPSNLMMLAMTWFGSAGLVPKRISTCDSISVIVSLTAAGEGVAILPPAVVGRELLNGSLQIIPTRPELVRPRLYIAYQADKLGPGLKLVIEVVRDVVNASDLLVQRSHATLGQKAHANQPRSRGRRI